MYSSEIEQFLKERNYVVNRDECMKIMNSRESTQISEIKYYAASGQYQISTTDGYRFIFKVK